MLEHLFTPHIYRAAMSFRLLSVNLFLTTVISFSFAIPASAIITESRIPLMGCRGHYAASGSARYVTIRNEQKKADEEITTIEIVNVPLPPGTVLIVYVSDKQVGTIKLDAKQAGTLTLKSGSKSYPPPIGPETGVYIKTREGKLVLW